MFHAPSHSQNIVLYTNFTSFTSWHFDAAKTGNNRPEVSIGTVSEGNNSTGDTSKAVPFLGTSLEPEDSELHFSLLEIINLFGSGEIVAGDAVEALVSGDFLSGRFAPSAGWGVASCDKALLRAPAANAASTALDRCKMMKQNIILHLQICICIATKQPPSHHQANQHSWLRIKGHPHMYQGYSAVVGQITITQNHAKSREITRGFFIYDFFSMNVSSEGLHFYECQFWEHTFIYEIFQKSRKITRNHAPSRAITCHHTRGIACQIQKNNTFVISFICFEYIFMLQFTCSLHSPCMDWPGKASSTFWFQVEAPKVACCIWGELELIRNLEYICRGRPGHGVKRPAQASFTKNSRRPPSSAWLQSNGGTWEGCRCSYHIILI